MSFFAGLKEEKEAHGEIETEHPGYLQVVHKPKKYVVYEDRIGGKK
jgi:hypothetical protein